MKWEIKSDYQHQEFYRKVLDELEDRRLKAREAYLNVHWEDSSFQLKASTYEQRMRNYILVKQRYERERFARRWGH